MKNKILYVLLIILVVGYLGLNYFGKDKSKNFEDEIVKIDISKIDKIEIQAKDTTKNNFSFIKKDNKWLLNSNGKEFETDSNSIAGILANISNIKVKDVVTKNPKKFAKYELEDNNSKEIKLFSNTKLIRNLLIGKLNFNPQNRSATSYFRIKDDDKIYSTNSFISASLSDDLNTYRNKEISNFDAKSINAITINDKEIIKKENHWYIDNISLDSTKIAQYLNSIAHIKGSQFIDDNKTNEAKLVDKISFNKGMLEITSSIENDNKSFGINSSINKNAQFKSDSTGIYKTIFLDLKQIISN